MIKLFNGDSLEVLATIPKNSIDSIVCDPPYGIACKQKGFNFIGIEREKEFFEIAKARIDSV